MPSFAIYTLIIITQCNFIFFFSVGGGGGVGEQSCIPQLGRRNLNLFKVDSKS